jgi:hypothetical protein
MDHQPVAIVPAEPLVGPLYTGFPQFWSNNEMIVITVPKLREPHTCAIR